MFGVLREPLPLGFIPPYGHQPRIVYDQQNSRSNPIQVNNQQSVKHFTAC